MTIQLSEHFTYEKLARFTMPSVLMMVFISVYSIVDGVFVSNFVGLTPFAAVNLVWPVLMIMGAVGFMFGAGGSALVAKTLGEGDRSRANQIFSLLIYACIVLGMAVSGLGLILLGPVLRLFNIDGILLAECFKYGYAIMPAITFFMLQYVFQALLITAERPKFGLVITLLAGVTNVILDWLFIVVLDKGIVGAALATAASQGIGGIVPLLYFAFPNKSPLRLCKTHYDLKVLLKIVSNGLSEFLSNISASIVSILYNFQMLRLAGENGVIAYGIISYANFIFLAVFLGYAIGVAPIISFHYGAENKAELHNLFIKNLKMIAVAAIVLTLSAAIFAVPLAEVFVSYDEELLDMTVRGFHIYSLSFLCAGFTIYASSFFTALNNGIVSAIISFCRTLIFECLCVLILPIFFGIAGVWLAVVTTEMLALIVSVVFWMRLRTVYDY